MSTIERAMARMGGVPDEAPEQDDDLLEDAPPRAEPAVPAAQVPPPVAPAPAPTPQGPPLPASHHPGSSGRNLINVDFARLAAGGFIVPGSKNDAMQEEFQHIKRRLLANLSEGHVNQLGAPQNLVMVTSSVPNEGKTFTSVNLALSLAMEMDRTVLAVDTDVIKSDMSRVFGAYGRQGLFDVLFRGELELSDVLLSTNIPKLTLLPAGTVRHNVTERLASDAMRRLTMEMAQRYPDRIILFDCPPVLATSGATALAPLVGQVVMVVEASKTTHETLKHALQMMEHVQVTGLVLNKVREQQKKHYYYYGYDDAPKQT